MKSCIFRHSTMQSVEIKPIFGDNISPPSSGSKDKPSKQSLILACRWFPAWLTFRPWRWRRHVPPKHWFTFNGLHGVITQNIELFVFVYIREVPSLNLGPHIGYLFLDFLRLFPCQLWYSTQTSQPSFLSQVVPQLRRLFVAFPSRRPESDPSSGHVGFSTQSVIEVGFFPSISVSCQFSFYQLLLFINHPPNYAT
jgi:hypothetical protein